MTRILLKNGELGMIEGVFEADLLIENGKIEGFYKRDEKVEADQVIDCSQKMILPGFIDVHVHFREPGAAYKEDWESGSKVAVCAGITTVFDMPNNEPPIFTVDDLEKKLALISGRSYVNYGLYMGFNGENLDEILKAKGIVGVKIYTVDLAGNVGIQKKMEELFKNFKGIIVAHAEDGICIQENMEKYLSEGQKLVPDIHSKIHSPECAAKAVQYLCELAKKTGARLHIAHISTDAELEIVNRYENVTCEVSPHHLLFCTDDYETKGNLIKVNPPIRDRTDLFALWKGLKMEEIDIIATDHAPHTLEEKEQDYEKCPSGVPGIGFFMPIMMNAVNDDGLTIPEVVRLCSLRPAEIFEMKNKGKLEDGCDADIVVVDMDLERKIERKNVKDKCGWSPYEGSTFKGWPIMTFVKGNLIAKNGEIVGKAIGAKVSC